MYHFVYPQPNCKTCGEPMKSWNPWIKRENQEHLECAAKRMVDEGFEKVNLKNK